MASAIEVAAFRRAHSLTGLRRAARTAEGSQAPALSAAWSGPTACHRASKSRDDLIGSHGAPSKPQGRCAGNQASLAAVTAGARWSGRTALRAADQRRYEPERAVVDTECVVPVRCGLPRLRPCCSAATCLRAKAVVGAEATRSASTANRSAQPSLWALRERTVLVGFRVRRRARGGSHEHAAMSKSSVPFPWHSRPR